jgi:3-deoxy-manno-octulosonate cytidylyltransferase (CMP-KDO synthetase)
MRCIALIPARIGATRFPGKMLAKIKGKSVIRRTYESTVNTGLFEQVIVVSDSDEIIAEIESCGGRAVKSKAEYESGTDRIAEVVQSLDADVFVNVQGDEPFVQLAPMAALLDLFRDDPALGVGSLVQVMHDDALIADPNYVKVALDNKRNALFFSRSMIPYPRNKEAAVSYYEHIGVYAFRKDALMQFTKWPMSPLESVEKIECLRFLEHGVPIRMSISDYMGVEIDMPEDITRAERFMEANGLV